MKKLILLLCLSISCLISRADFVTENTAQAAAEKFLSFQSVYDSLTLVHTEYVDSSAMFYIFDISSGGYIIMAADDIMEPIRAYVPNGNYNINSNNPGLAVWKEWNIRFFEDSVISITQSSRKLNEWSFFTNPSNNQSVSIVQVGPLLNTAWSQGPPSCENSVVVANTDIDVPVGCVATAFGQIINYYQHPYQGTGISTYTDPANTDPNFDITNSYGNQTVNHSNYTFDWGNMSDSIGQYGTTFCKDGDDVAQLLYNFGVSIEMDYSTDGSEAYSSDGEDPLKTNFGYDDCLGHHIGC